eukprot:Awhi_evm1s9870
MNESQSQLTTAGLKNLDETMIEVLHIVTSFVLLYGWHFCLINCNLFPMLTLIINAKKTTSGGAS